LRFLRRASAWNQDRTALRSLAKLPPTSSYKKQQAASLLLSALPLAPTKDFSASSYSSLCVLGRRNPTDSEGPTAFVIITAQAHSTFEASRDRWPTTSHGEGLEFWASLLLAPRTSLVGGEELSEHGVVVAWMHPGILTIVPYDRVRSHLHAPPKVFEEDPVDPPRS
jgi:hypothetical protein